jgi:hypothetical protein
MNCIPHLTSVCVGLVRNYLVGKVRGRVLLRNIYEARLRTPSF